MEQQRKRKTKIPCTECGLHQMRCLCDLIPKLSLKTRLCLVIHSRELKRTTNTGQLAIKSLENSVMRVRGKQGEPLNLSADLNSEYQSLLLFPCEDASKLTQNYLTQYKKPIQLIVPDGNWRQASKVHTRHRELEDVPRVKLRKSEVDKLLMRNENVPDGMATLQAIAVAFKILEGDEVGLQLEQLYLEKLKRTLEGRGTLFK